MVTVRSLLFGLSLILPIKYSAAASILFERDIRPILKTHCFQCHGESGVKEGALDVRLRHWIIAGGDSGAAIQPHEPSQSLLLERVAAGEMPPGEKKLSTEEISLLRQWISQGAKTARAEPESLDDGDYITDEERRFWSFQPIRRPRIPEVPSRGLENPIDSFVFERLQTEGLVFSERGARATLIRRATFDLWGLPPDPKMVDEFLADESENAYEKLIDRLLASPRYGERWGRHWLDVAGYADSDGYNTEDVVREFAFFYRDYVIDSFNANKPLDQFIREQLAGDEIDVDNSPSSPALTSEHMARLAATGFLRTAPDGTASGSVDRELAANATIADTLEIVTTSLLGLTVGCARCHDHRYDPISQADYYRFRAIFEPALDWKQWKLPAERQISLYTDEERQRRSEIEALAKEAELKRAQRQKEHIERTLYEELLVAPDDRRELLEIAFRTEKAKRTDEQVGLLEEFPNVGNITPGSLYLYAEQRARRAGDIEKAAQERETRFITQVEQEQLAKVPAEQQAELRDILAIADNARTSAQKSLVAKYPELKVTPESLEQLLPEGFAEVQRYLSAAKTCRETDAKTDLANLQVEIAAIRATAPPERFVRVLTEPANHTPPTYLFIRGDHQQSGPQLEPNELTVLQSFSAAEIADRDPARSTSGRRLAYARHLTDGKHPLVARVLVNRIWHHHFGHGLVDTLGDFGRLGSKPTHPELLDWLADELMRTGWDVKRMHRLMLLSRTYQQASLRTAELDRIDPENRLYARMSVRRLESEAIRDAILSASGILVDQLHGPPIPVKEDAVGQIVLGKEMLDGERKPTGQDPTFEGASRRSIYIQVRRSRPLAVLEAFDIATVAPNCTNRNYSNVAPQSLLMMNSQFAIDHADHMARRLIEAESDLNRQISEAWMRCFGCAIDASVLEEVKNFVGLQASAFRSNDGTLTVEAAHELALASACQAMFSSNEFLYVD